MKHRFFFLIALAGFVGSISAQDPQGPQLPSGVLLKRTPEYSKWTVVIQGIQGAAEASSSKGGGAKSSIATQSTVTKTGSIILEQNVDPQGKSQDIWHYKGARAMRIPKVLTPMISPDRADDDIYSVDFAVSDFAGLSWVSAKTFVGIEKYDGRDCMVFKDKVSPLTYASRRLEANDISEARNYGHNQEAIIVPAVAYIDLETRLPVYVTFGDQKRTYQYSTIPHEPLTLPPDLANAVKAYGQKIQRLSAPTVRAY